MPRPHPARRLPEEKGRGPTRKKEFRMTLTRMALLLAVAGFAARLYLIARRRAAVPRRASTATQGDPAPGTVVRAVSGAGSPDDVLLLGGRGFAEIPPR